MRPGSRRKLMEHAIGVESSEIQQWQPAMKTAKLFFFFPLSIVALAFI